MPNFYNLMRARKFSTAADTALEIAPHDSATPNFTIEAGGRLNWSSGSANPDTNLYRSAANTLKTDDSFDLASGQTYKVDGADVLTATSLGSSIINSSLTSVGTLSSLSVSGRADISEIRETVSSVSISSGTLTCDYTSGCVFYIESMSGVSANFTVNATNIPTDNNYAITISIIVNQGSPGYYPSVLQIAGSNQSIKWVNDTAPSVNANRIDIYNFTLIRVSDAWVVLGSASNNYDTI
jgi:3D (Asp-Asp-Asp) domain-containing protein